LLIAPSSDAQAIHAAIPGSKSNGQGGFTVPCTTTAQVALTFGGTSFAIDSRDIAFAPIDPNNPTGDCVSGIGTVNFLAEHQWLVSANRQFKSMQNDDHYPISRLAASSSGMPISPQMLGKIRSPWLNFFRGLVQFLY
jgi:hypothetical protein